MTVSTSAQRFAGVVAITRSTVERLKPSNVDPSSVTVTGEGPDVTIVLVPHRDLDGLSLVVWADMRTVDLRWAHIRDLSTHDEIDLGATVATIAWESDWGGLLETALMAELRRTIEIDMKKGWFGRNLIVCRIILADRVREIVIRPPRSWRPDGSSPSSRRTSLDGGGPLAFSFPPAVDRWRAQR